MEMSFLVLFSPLAITPFSTHTPRTNTPLDASVLSWPTLVQILHNSPPVAELWSHGYSFFLLSYSCFDHIPPNYNTKGFIRPTLKLKLLKKLQYFGLIVFYGTLDLIQYCAYQYYILSLTGSIIHQPSTCNTISSLQSKWGI